MMSSALQWELIKKTSCFVVKDKKIGASFSKEPNNLHGRNCYRFNGLIHDRVVGVTPSDDRKGLVLSYKKGKKFQNKPNAMFARVDLRKRDPRKVYRTIRRTLGGMKYRPELRELAVRRASVLMRRQMQSSRKSRKNRKGKGKKSDN